MRNDVPGAHLRRIRALKFVSKKLTASSWGRTAALIAVLGLTQLGQAQPVSGPSWMQLNPSNVPPYGNDSSDTHTAAYDPSTNTMILVTGGNFSGPGNNTYLLSYANGTGVSVWSQLNAPGPAHTSASLIYDPNTNQALLFGGGTYPTNQCAAQNELWSLSNANGTGVASAWTQLNPAGVAPGPRSGHTAVFNPTTNRMIVFGGRNPCVADYNDVWILQNANGTGGSPAWAPLTVSNAGPPARSRHTAVYDTANNRMIVFGGIGSAFFNDVWVLSNADGTGGTAVWSQLSPTGSGPTPRLAHNATYDPSTNRMVIFGGMGPTCCAVSNDVWVLSNANGRETTTSAWTQLNPAGTLPTTRYGASSVYDPATYHVTIFAGGSETFSSSCNCWVGGSLMDTWVLADAIGPIPNTLIGSGIRATPVDASGNSPVTLTFQTITQAGNTTLTTSSNGPPPPTGFKLGKPPTYYDLATTAMFSGSIRICINYTGVSYTNPSLLRLYHNVSGTFVDTMAMVDTSTNMICATVTSLSPFVIVEPVPFAPFSVKLDNVSLSSGSYQMTSAFTLGSGAAALDPVRQPVTVQVGSSSITIPAGSFQLGNKGDWTFFGTIGGAALQIQIAPTGSSSYSFKAQVTGTSLTGTTSPVPVVILIGTNVGTISVPANIGQ